MRMPHDPDAVARLREPTAEEPWRVLVSGCMAGLACGVDGTDYGFGNAMSDFFGHPLVEARPFCPEDAGLGTPRTWPDIHGGDGEAVLRGTARVLDEHGADLTEGMLVGAEAMAAYAKEQRVDFAVLMDMSGACGSQVISDGCRFDDDRRYQRGVGVAAARLLRDGVAIVSQRDYRTLELLWRRLDPSRTLDEAAIDHHEIEWYRDYFDDL